MIVVAEEVSDLANGESQCEKLFDSLQTCVKLAFLKGAFRFAKCFALVLFGGQRFFRSQAIRSRSSSAKSEKRVITIFELVSC